MDRDKDSIMRGNVLSYVPERTGAITNRRYYVRTDKVVYSKLREWMLTGVEIQKMVKRELRLKRNNILEESDTLHVFMAKFETKICTKYSSLPKSICKGILKTIYYFGNRNGNIKYWYFDVDLLNVEKPKRIVKPITHMDAMCFRNIINGEEIILPFYSDSELSNRAKVDTKYRILNSRVSLQYGSIIVDLSLYAGGYNNGVVIKINNRNPMYMPLRNILNLPYIYGNLLLTTIREVIPSQITRNKGHKGLYNRLYKLLTKDGDRILAETHLRIMDKVASDIFNDICKHGRIPKTYNIGRSINIFIKQVSYGKIVTDIGVIDEIDSMLEAKGYVDYKKAVMFSGNNVLYIYVPNKGEE